MNRATEKGVRFCVSYFFALAFFCSQVAFCGGYLEIPKIDFSPRIDGLVTPRERSGCQVTTLTLMGAFQRPKHETFVYTCATRDALYVGFVCADPEPKALVTSVTAENGPVMKDDSVEMVLCPALYGERNNYFHFAMNAAGVKYSWDSEFDRPVTGWTGKASVTPGGWEAEFLIPYTSIRGRTDISHWRGNFVRTRPARSGQPEEVSVWNDPGMTIHNYRKFGFLRFVKPKEEDIESLLQQLMELRQQELQSTQTEKETTATQPAASETSSVEESK